MSTSPFKVEVGYQIEGTSFNTKVIQGSVDPSAGAGLAADIGDNYRRKSGSVGELWIKFGAADTAWLRYATESYVDTAVANLSSGTRWRAELVAIATGDDFVASANTTVVADGANTDTTFKVASLTGLKVGQSVDVDAQTGFTIASISIPNTTITLDAPLTGIPVGSEAVVATSVSTILFSDDDGTAVTSPAEGEFVLTGIGDAVNGLKLFVISGGEYVAADDALAIGDVFIINAYLPVSENQGEDYYEVVVTNIAAGTVKAVPFNPRLADEVNLTDAYSASAGTISSGDSIQAAIAKLDGNGSNVYTVIGVSQGDSHLGTSGNTAGTEIFGDTSTVKNAVDSLAAQIGIEAGLVPVTRTKEQLVTTKTIMELFDQLDSLAGADADLTPEARTTGMVTQASSIYGKIDQVDASIGPDTTPTTRTVGPLVAANSSNINLNALDAAIGTNAQLADTEHVSTSNSVNQNLSSISSGVKSLLERDNVLAMAADTPTDVYSELTLDFRMLELTVSLGNDTSGNFYGFKVIVAHDRAGATIATQTDDNRFGFVQKPGATKLLKSWSTSVSGVGAAQVMKLTVEAAEAGTDVSIQAQKLL